MKIVIAPDGQSASVTQIRHTTEIESLERARMWVKFYDDLADGKTGKFYTKAAAAFREALRGMENAQGIKHGSSKS